MNKYRKLEDMNIEIKYMILHKELDNKRKSNEVYYYSLLDKYVDFNRHSEIVKRLSENNQYFWEQFDILIDSENAERLKMI